MTRYIAPMFIGTLMLAGCGGSGGGDGCSTGDFCDISADLEETLEEAGLGSINDVDDEPGTDSSNLPTPIDDLPDSGDVTFSGQVAVQLEVNDVQTDLILGNTEMVVTFTETNGSFSGTASSFVSQTNGRYAGELDLSNGELIQGGDEFVAGVNAATGSTSSGTLATQDLVGMISDVDGTLTAAGGAETTFDGNFIGTFNGDDADVIGIARGDTESNGVSGEFLGVLVAVQ